MALVASTLAVVKGLGPGTVRYGSGCELVKALAQELRTAWLFLGSWVHWVMGFEMRTASHGETLIRSRKPKERLGLV